MKRDLYQHLLSWKHDPNRRPLLIQGARQVGKSWLIREFSKEFDFFIELNLEKMQTYAQIFAGNLDANTVLRQITLFTQQDVIPGRTLIFIDEIQCCEKALTALRYFYEEAPEVHVIAAGSLVKFAVNKVGIPVGRVAFAHLYPLSFGEFLEAIGHAAWRAHLVEEYPRATTLHEPLLELVKLYCWLGGMPAVVAAWQKNQSPQECLTIQDHLITAYKQDFLKYASIRLIDKVDRLFTYIPLQLGNKFKYVHVDSTQRAATLKEALHLLAQADIAHICYHTSAQGLPLAGGINEKFYKVFFFDVGLAQRLLGLDLTAWMSAPLEVNTLGGIAEQFVAQELIAYQDRQQQATLYYWHRESKSSNAEVDFVVSHNHDILPIEVKSGKKGSYKSLHSFLQSHSHSAYGIVVSEQSAQKNHPIQWVALYQIEGFIKSSI